MERGRERARLAGAEQVEPEHLLLALACGGASGAAARALAEAGIDDEAIAAAIEQELVAALEVVGVPASVVDSIPALPRGDRPPIGFAVRAALECSLREAQRTGSRRIGLEHVLLGLLRPPAATVDRVLRRLDVTPERLIALVQLEIAAARRCA